MISRDIVPSRYQTRVYNGFLRYFFSRRIPDLHRVLLVESGSREILNRLIPVLRRQGPAGMQIDLVTCFPGVPEGFSGRVYHVAGYPGPEARQRLYDELARLDYALTGIICSGEPIMTKWKWVLAARLHSKLLVMNENADFFWVDWGHLRNIARLALHRMGMSGGGAVPASVRLLAFPLTLLYLLLFAGAVHFRRKMRMS